MKPILRNALVLACGSLLPLHAAETTAAAKPAPESPAAEAAPSGGPTADSAAKKPAEENPLKKEQESLALENSLNEQRLRKETATLRAEIEKMKVEKEALMAKLDFDSAKRRAAEQEEIIKTEQARAKISREAEIAKAEAEKVTAELKILQTQSQMQIGKLQSEMAELDTTQKRSQYTDTKPTYLDNPLKDDGTLVISDRRIPLNGPITMDTADFICDRISYYNNKDRKMPMFIVIDASPGGSVMAGVRILKAMEGSDAPVYVVVKSFAASMAAGITTLAEKSFAYPNAVILHHQVSTMNISRMNLTQQKEAFSETERWWVRLAEPIAKKMGLTLEQFRTKMYEQSTSGDWSEFGTEAQKLKWVDNLVTRIDETSFIKNPDSVSTPPSAVSPGALLKEEMTAEGKPVIYLPRLTPKDAYFLYNPDTYYQMR